MGIGVGIAVGTGVGAAVGTGEGVVGVIGGGKPAGVGMAVAIGSSSTQKAYRTVGPATAIVIGLMVLSEPSGMSPSQRRKP